MAEAKGQWKCNTCNATKDVENGYCKECGPTQTTPVDETAKKLGGFYEAEAERSRNQNAETVESKEPSATDGK